MTQHTAPAHAGPLSHYSVLELPWGIGPHAAERHLRAKGVEVTGYRADAGVLDFEAVRGGYRAYGEALFPSGVLTGVRVRWVREDVAKADEPGPWFGRLVTELHDAFGAYTRRNTATAVVREWPTDARGSFRAALDIQSGVVTVECFSGPRPTSIAA